MTTTKIAFVTVRLEHVSNVQLFPQCIQETTFAKQIDLICFTHEFSLPLIESARAHGYLLLTAEPYAQGISYYKDFQGTWLETNPLPEHRFRYFQRNLHRIVELSTYDIIVWLDAKEISIQDPFFIQRCCDNEAFQAKGYLDFDNGAIYIYNMKHPNTQTTLAEWWEKSIQSKDPTEWDHFLR